MAGRTAEVTSRALKIHAPACNWQALAFCLEISFPERGCEIKEQPLSQPKSKVGG